MVPGNPNSKVGAGDRKWKKASEVYDNKQINVEGSWDSQSQWELKESVEGVEQGFAPPGSRGHGRGDFILSFPSLFA